MRILQLVDGNRWTGVAAVVFDQTAALIAAGLEAQFAFTGGGALERRLQPIGWARPLLETKTRWPLGLARQVRRVRETVLREKFDVIHAHRSHDHYVAALAIRGTSARLVRTLHHVRHARPDPLSALVFGRTDAFAHANREIARRARRPGPVLPPVIDVERFRPAAERSRELCQRFGLPEDRLLAGTVAKITRGRGHEEAIEAAAPLPSVALVHVGQGDYIPYLKEKAAGLGTAARNFWVGYQEEILPELYRLWDVFLFTASGADQGQRAILEAMASGVPVVACDLPGVRDLVTDGREGVIATNCAGLLPALRRLAESEETRRRYAQAGRARAMDFTAAKFAERVVPFYEGVLSTKRVSSTC
jgi:glycosyltransferase involved in cell wall biosynthesis